MENDESAPLGSRCHFLRRLRRSADDRVRLCRRRAGVIPMLYHDGLPRIDQAMARITTCPALRKGFAAQMPGDSAPADAKAKADPVP